MNESFDQAARRMPRHSLSDSEKEVQLSTLFKAIDGQPWPGTTRRRRGRKVAIVVAVVIGLAATGVGTAAAFGVFSAPPTDRRVAHCYTTVSLGNPRNHEDVTV